LLWGGAYLATAWAYTVAPWLLLVFALEKALYVRHYAAGLQAYKTWAPNAKRDSLTHLFFCIYGLGDAVFGGLFVVILAVELAR